MTAQVCAHPTSLGDVILRTHCGDDGRPESVEVLHADPRVLIGGQFLREVRDGAQCPRLPFATADKAEVGGTLRVNGSNRRLVYLITEYEPDVDGIRFPDVYVGEWPD